MFNHIHHTIDRDAATDVAGIHRSAYNAAFYELGLRWYWDGEIYPEVLNEADERRCLQQYMVTHQPHLLMPTTRTFSSMPSRRRRRGAMTG